MDLRRLRVLLELEQRGTVSAVATALHLTPSAVSQQLSALAKELGVTLTEPNGRRLRLTGAARVVLEHARQISDQVEAMYAGLAAWREGAAGEVCISGFATTLAPLILPAAGLLRQRRPQLRTLLSEVDPPESYDLLAQGRTDIVVAAESAQVPVLDRRLHKVTLLEEVFDVALPTGHALTGAPSIRLDDLAKEPWIFATVGMCQEIPLAACARAGFTPQAAHAIGDWEATFAAVAQGLGISLVPRLARPFARDGVVVRPFADAPARRIFAAVRAGQEHAPEIAVALAALADASAMLVDGARQA